MKIEIAPRLSGLFAPMFILGIMINGTVVWGASCHTNIPESTPDSRFEDLADGTVRDLETGLMWKKCLQGLSGADCSVGVAKKSIWQDALQTAVADGTGGHNDWRLANKNELYSIVENRCSPSINSNIFPNVGTVWHWTSTPVYENDTEGKAVRIDFRTGGTASYFIQGRGLSEMVFRLVRGGR